MTLTAVITYAALLAFIAGAAFWLSMKSKTPDKHEKEIQAKSIPEPNSYSRGGCFLIEHLPHESQPYTVWRLSQMLALDNSKRGPRGFSFWTRADADAFCERKEGISLTHADKV